MRTTRFSRGQFALVAAALFLFIYGPPFRALPLNISTLLGVLAWVFVARNPSLLAQIRTFQLELLLLFAIVVYSLVTSIRGGDPGFLVAPVTLLIFNVPFCVWISSFILEKSGDRSSMLVMMDLLAAVAIVAALLSVLLAISPEIGEFVKFQLMKYDDVLMEFQAYRAFGLSDELLFSFSLVQGVIGVLIVRTYGLRLWTLAAVLLLLASISLNARIGLLMIAALPFAIRWNVSRVLLMAALVMGLVIFFNFSEDPVIVLIGDQAAYFGREMGGMLTGDIKGSTFDTLFSEMFFMPVEGWELIFGSGKNFFLDSRQNTDSGYILMLGYGGVVYLTTVFLFVYVCLWRAIRRRKYAFYMVLLVCTFIIANVKGLFFAAKPGMHMFLLLHVFLVMEMRSRQNRVSKAQAVAGAPQTTQWQAALSSPTRPSQA